MCICMNELEKEKEIPGEFSSYLITFLLHIAWFGAAKATIKPLPFMRDYRHLTS